MENVITSCADYARATEETKRLHEVIADELKSDIREAAEGHALAVVLLTKARRAYILETDSAEAYKIANAAGFKDANELLEETCETCGLTLDMDKGSQCYNQTHSFMCDVFHEYADASDPEACEDADCVHCCDCARCASGEVRHCPECGPNEGAENERESDAIDDDCTMCEGTGAVSRSRS